MRKTHRIITQLKPNEVFVFGSNLSGFHGAGAAGLAMRGNPDNTWRLDEAFLDAAEAPEGSPERVGKWAVFGVGEGFQRGKEGCSYAIPTVTRAGSKRSISLNEILGSLIKLSEFATQHPELTFYCCIMSGGYNGYSYQEIMGLYRR